MRQFALLICCLIGAKGRIHSPLLVQPPAQSSPSAIPSALPSAIPSVMFEGGITGGTKAVEVPWSSPLKDPLRDPLRDPSLLRGKRSDAGGSSRSCKAEKDARARAIGLDEQKRLECEREHQSAACDALLECLAGARVEVEDLRAVLEGRPVMGGTGSGLDGSNGETSSAGGSADVLGSHGAFPQVARGERQRFAAGTTDLIEHRLWVPTRSDEVNAKGDMRQGSTSMNAAPGAVVHERHAVKERDEGKEGEEDPFPKLADQPTTGSPTGSPTGSGISWDEFLQMCLWQERSRAGQPQPRQSDPETKRGRRNDPSDDSSGDGALTTAETANTRWASIARLLPNLNGNLNGSFNRALSAYNATNDVMHETTDMGKGGSIVLGGGHQEECAEECAEETRAKKDINFSFYVWGCIPLSCSLLPRSNEHQC